RKINFERRAPRGFAIDPDMSATLLYDAVDRRQSQPASLPHFLRRKEWFKDTGPRGFIHPHPVVADREHDVASGSHGVFAGKTFVEVNYSRVDNEFSATRHGIPGIHCEIEHNLIELTGVHLHHRCS